MNDWIQTFSGVAFRPLDPRPEDVRIEDIAHGLSNCCRFSGQCREFMSVAQHSVHVSERVCQENALWGLLHDASEAYICDMPRPIKQCMPEYRAHEERLMQVIAQAFRLAWPIPKDIKAVDMRMLATERRDLMGPSQPWMCLLGVEPYPMEINPMTPRVAEKHFLRRYLELTEMRRAA